MPVAIRLAVAGDAALILEMVREHAAHDGRPEAVRAGVEDFRHEGFGATPAFECLIAEADHRPAGIALFFQTFSSWTGRRGIFLDDLFVRAPARGRGVGAALMRRLATLAIERGCTRLDLNVLEGIAAHGFYRRLGLRHTAEWHPYRVDGTALKRLAQG